MASMLPCQKKTQLDLEQHEHLHDVTCCWLYVRAYMEKVFPGDVISKHEEMWQKGFLGKSFPGRLAAGGQPNPFWLTRR